MNKVAHLAFSLVIPMHNEEDNVFSFIEEIDQHLRSLPQYEIIVVDDGSTDSTWQKLHEIKDKIQNLKVFRHKKNKGQSAAVVSGVKLAQFPWVATIDGDGQNCPADILKLIEAVPNESDYLIAGHRQKRQDSQLKLFSSRIANAVRAKLLKDDCPDSGCGLKLFPRQRFLSLPHFNHMHRFLPALFRSIEVPIINVEVKHRPRVHGQSKYGLNNRLWVGIIDLFGVSWLIKRNCLAEILPDAQKQD